MAFYFVKSKPCTHHVNTVLLQENKLAKEKYATFWQRWEKKPQGLAEVYFIFLAVFFPFFLLLHFNTTKYIQKDQNK